MQIFVPYKHDLYICESTRMYLCTYIYIFIMYIYVYMNMPTYVHVPGQRRIQIRVALHVIRVQIPAHIHTPYVYL